MYILGINAYHPDSSACIINDGVLITAIEEERITRIKHWAGFPILSIKHCLKEANIKLSDVDYISINRDPKVNLFKKLNGLNRSENFGSNAGIEIYKKTKKYVFIVRVDSCVTVLSLLLKCRILKMLTIM